MLSEAFPHVPRQDIIQLVQDYLLWGKLSHGAHTDTESITDLVTRILFRTWTTQDGQCAEHLGNEAAYQTGNHMGNQRRTKSQELVSQELVNQETENPEERGNEELEEVLEGVRCRLMQMHSSRKNVSAREGISEEEVCNHDWEFLHCCRQYLDCHLKIVFEDERFVAVNKPWDYRIDLRTGDAPNYIGEPTLAAWFQNRYGYPVRFCHQLDYATSGILLMAKDRKSCGAVGKKFVARQVEKLYSAILLGEPDITRVSQPAEEDAQLPDGNSVLLSSSGWQRVEFDLKEDGYRMVLCGDRKESGAKDDVKSDDCKGQDDDCKGQDDDCKGQDDDCKGQGESGAKKGVSHACTYMKMIRRGKLTGEWFENDRGKTVTHVYFRPKTGRRHQLRMTAWLLGAPILGDMVYGNRIYQQAPTGQPLYSEMMRTHARSYRMYLHAKSLSMKLPWYELKLNTDIDPLLNDGAIQWD
ncbi:pseudouridine synthase [Gregarina niphandrodes]|uniref:Pseudouridine synthase n=1 Tax=Gregarina niphandrodes TaxID=110365 RepID=A0A023B588_GRENI|nr:pseudouridine synthase [Gregarina niphandrodes]EZG59048.1 pseudouridine synthase [Gregarina niphandrodes]|eukprot:XP_011130914.1 pseudouridine synthase [Gregarina niphandrodes]